MPFGITVAGGATVGLLVTLDPMSKLRWITSLDDPSPAYNRFLRFISGATPVDHFLIILVNNLNTLLHRIFGLGKN